MKYLLIVDHLYQETGLGRIGATLTIPLLGGGVVVDEVRVSGRTESTYRRTVDVPPGSVPGAHACDGSTKFTFQPLE
ncbi:hypothetical protein ACOANU_13410 [Pseudomonas aeruginosa]|nr:hypothetical protein [Pseudomonas aeruginosa]HEP9081458.1 hypothetical protein [Pseudomonas aeruginosa]